MKVLQKCHFTWTFQMLENQGQIHSLGQACLTDFTKQNIRNFQKFLEHPLHLLKFLLKWLSFKIKPLRVHVTFYRKE